MTTARPRPAVGLALLLLTSALACDASYTGFLDAVPVPDTAGGGPTDVLLAVDGLSREAYDLARGRGAFADYRDGDLITAFPGTSDYAWTRTLGTGSLPGYEIQYFDPRANRLHNEGLGGVIEHPIREGLAGSFACYRRFDFLGDGYFWMARGYQDPEAALPGTLDELFAVLLRRSRTQRHFLAYLLNVDVLGHKGGLSRTVEALVEIDRRVQEFQRRHPGRFRFTLFGDHGNAHRQARLIDPVEVVRRAGVDPVKRLGDGTRLEAVAVVHVRVTYVALHTAAAQAAEVAARLSGQPEVDLAVADLGTDQASGQRRFGLWKQGRAYTFTRRADGGFQVENPQAWSALGIALPPPGVEGQPLALTAEAALDLTAAGPYPDLLYRAATAFTHPAADHPATVLLSLPDDVASYGFHVPGSGDGLAIDGFHGGLSRGGSVSVLASQSTEVPPVVRSDDLLRLLPALAP